MKELKFRIEKYQGLLFPVLDTLINGINLFIHIYISWYLSQSEYGILNAVFSFITLIMVTGVSIQIYIAKSISDPTWKDENFSSIYKYCRNVLLKVGFILLLISPIIIKILRVNYLIYITVLIIFISNGLLSIYRGVYQGKKMFLYLSRSFYIEVIIRVTSISAFIYIFKDKYFAVLGMCLGMFITFLIDSKKVNKLIGKVDKIDLIKNDTLRRVFTANFFYYYLTSVSLIITNFALPDKSGLFAVSIRYSQMYIHIGFSIITVLIPVLSSYKYDLKIFKKKATKFLLICIGAGFLALLLYKFIFPNTVESLFGLKYLEAKNYIFLHAVGYFLFIIGSYFVSMEIILDTKKYIKTMLLASTILTLGLMIFNNNVLNIIYVEIVSFAFIAIRLGFLFYKKEEDQMTNQKRKMTILFLSWRDIKAPKKGGAEVFTHEMLRLVDTNKYNIVHYSPMFDGSKEEEYIDGVKYIRKGNIFSVILFAFLYYLKNKKNIDYVVDQCNEHRFFTPFWVSRNKRIFFIHQMGRELWLRNLKFPFSRIGYYSEDFMTKLYRKNLTFTVSPSTKKDLLDLGFKEERIRILPEGINFRPWDPEEFLEKDESYTFTYVGRFARYKGIDSAVKAFGELRKLYPETKMWIVGKENELFKNEILKPIIDEYKLEVGKDIIFHGFVSEEKKLELMSRSHTILYPSDREGWGLSVTEAGAVGTPSIVYNSPGLVDAVNQGDAGIITKTNDPEGILKAMLLTIENKKYYKNIKKKAYDFSKKFQWTETALVLEDEMVIFDKEGLQ